jgi:hypothetical protein
MTDDTLAHALLLGGCKSCKFSANAYKLRIVEEPNELGIEWGFTEQEFYEVLICKHGKQILEVCDDYIEANNNND